MPCSPPSPPAEIAALDERKAHGIGLDALRLPLRAGEDGRAAPEEFQQALIRLKQSSGLFLEQSKGAIEFFGSRLFRSHIYLPASAARASTGSSSISSRTARSLAKPAPTSSCPRSGSSATFGRRAGLSVALRGCRRHHGGADRRRRLAHLPQVLTGPGRNFAGQRFFASLGRGKRRARTIGVSFGDAPN